MYLPTEYTPKALLPFYRFLLPVSIFLASCASLREPEFRAVENIRVDRIAGAGSSLDLDVRYFNPNKTSVKLKEAGGSAWLDGQFLGTFRVDTMVHIPARAEFTLPVKLDVDMKKLFRNSIAVLLKREVTLKLDGKAKLGKGLVFINYPIRYEGKQEIDKLFR